MVAAAHFYGTSTDQHRLLDYLGEPQQVTLHPWPVVQSPLQAIPRLDALSRQQLMVVSRELGEPTVIRMGDPAMAESSRAGVFNRLNWQRLRPKSPEGLVDSNRSPVLLWTPATETADELRSGTIGSQADSMSAVSKEYELWVNRAMNWVRRKATKVWGLETTAIRPDLDIRRTDVTTVYALPDALAALERGATAS